MPRANFCSCNGDLLFPLGPNFPLLDWSGSLRARLQVHWLALYAQATTSAARSAVTLRTQLSLIFGSILDRRHVKCRGDQHHPSRSNCSITMSGCYFVSAGQGHLKRPCTSPTARCVLCPELEGMSPSQRLTTSFLVTGLWQTTRKRRDWSSWKQER